MSPPEYGVTLVSILGLVLIGSTLLGEATRHSLELAGVAAQGENGFSADPAAEAAVEPAVAPLAGRGANSLRFTVNLGLILTGSLLALAGALCWRRMHPPAAEPSEEESPAPLELPADARETIFRKRQRLRRILSANLQALFAEAITVEHVMSDCVEFVPPEATKEEVAERLREKFCRHMLVCDERRQLLGVISNRDLSKPAASTARELMTPSPLSVTPDSLVNQAITTLIQHQISSLPVVVEGRPVGVVTTTDLLMTLQCALKVLQSVAQEVEKQPAESGGRQAESGGTLREESAAANVGG